MYLLTKVILAIMLGFISSALIGLITIPVFKHFRIGQKTSSYTSHSSKDGTRHRRTSHNSGWSHA